MLTLRYISEEAESGWPYSLMPIDSPGVGSIGVGKPEPGQNGGFISLHGQGIGLAGFMVPTLRVQSAMHVRICAGGGG